MNEHGNLPRILIIDDLFGRTHPDRRNEDRSNLCGQYLLSDVTADERGKGAAQKVKRPVAEVVFCRGQQPVCSVAGDTVENDLDGTMRVIREGWRERWPEGPRWSMVLLDLCFYTGRVTDESNASRGLGMPEGRQGDDDPDRYFGLRILRSMHDEFPHLPVIILSSKPKEPVSREYSRLGALAFLPRNEGTPEGLERFLWYHGLLGDSAGQIVGHSLGLLLALRDARRKAAVSGMRNVLIRGERGTGKELVARYLHRVGKDSSRKPFVVLNSAVLTPELYAAELFGVKSRTATGVDEREGLIKTAGGGDLFLDEVGDMLPQVQAGILRVLRERTITPIGARSAEPIEVRFLSATNVDIEGLAVSGRYRDDLLQRLSEGGTIQLPALRERSEDIPLLAGTFLRQAEDQNTEAVKGRTLTSEALKKIASYDWPGNVEELRKCIFSAVDGNPHVEYLYPVHVQIPEAVSRPTSSTSRSIESGLKETRAPQSVQAAGTLDNVADVLARFTFDGAEVEAWAGRLAEMQEAYARFIARYIEAALEATKKRTPETPEGEVKIHPALKLATGNSSLSASSAADVIKAFGRLCPSALNAILDEHPLLKEAYRIAVRLRPRNPKRRKRKGTS